MSEIPSKPAGYESDLSDLGACHYDSYCGEPIAWGFRIVGVLGEGRFNALSAFGSVEYVRDYDPSAWFLVVKRLTRDDATAKYGPVTKEDAIGKHKTITFGSRTFFAKSIV